MFPRRRKLSILQRTRDFLWPRAGWTRSTRYILHRVARLPGTPYTLAAGFACGAATSFTPLIGLHFVISAALAGSLRANIPAALLGTAVGNPWTFPFMWIWVYKLGKWMGAANGIPKAEDVDFAEMFGRAVHGFLRGDVPYLIDAIWPLWWPMFVGCLPTSVAVWFLFYWLLKPVVVTYQRRRLRRFPVAAVPAPDPQGPEHAP